MINISKQFNKLGDKFYSFVTPSGLLKPELIHVNNELADKLELKSELMTPRWLSILSGNTTLEDYQPLASIYAGHQFGQWVPQLGDGRALLIAEHKVGDDIWELQLKGAGKTPYSRMGDGRAVLRSSIREYLCSHAMHGLNIPTTEALTLVGSTTPISREEVETAATVLRVAPSFIRFGHFELFASRDQISELSKLTQFVIDHYYPECNNSKTPVINLLDKVIRNTAELIAKWQAVGFCHGVMNSDNMSILGLTLDYGPFGFLDSYNPNHICNHSDHEGRYSFGNQPQIAWWNLQRLGEALSTLNDSQTYREAIKHALDNFAKYFNQHYINLMGNKLGISNFTIEDLDLLRNLMNILEQSKADFTIFWRQLSHIPENNSQHILDYVTDRELLKPWLDKYILRRSAQQLNFSQSQELMLKTNPAIVLRNHLAHHAIEKAKIGDYTELNRLFEALSTPYAEKTEFSDYYAYPPNWASELSVSCSS